MKLVNYIILSLVITAVGIACGGGDTAPAPAATTAPVATAVPKATATAVPKPTKAPVATAVSEPTPVPPTATPVPTPVFPSTDLFTSFSAGGWNASYAIDNGSLFLLSTETPESKSVESLNLDFIPAMVGQTHSNLKNQSLGFSFHDYTTYIHDSIIGLIWEEIIEIDLNID